MRGVRMAKKRKVCSPLQGDKSDVCEELKNFIASENVKCVEAIKESNERRIAAVEESLTFALDSLSAVSRRQQRADRDIVRLKEDTEDLRRRLQQLEWAEDRTQQERRITTLLFSGPAIQAQSKREDFSRIIRSIVQQRMHHVLQSAQVKAMIRLRNGKMLVEFTTAAPGSDRDILFRMKSKLKGTGLVITESLTPRRQALFSELLQLRKERIIFSAFTMAGEIFVCRSRDAAPLRIAGPEAVRQLVGSGASRRPEQGRAQAESGGGPSPPALVPGREERRGTEERARALSGLSSGSVMEVVTHSPSVLLRPASRDADSGTRRNVTASRSASTGPDHAEGRERPGSSFSSLLECAREAAVDLVRLSPPLEDAPAAGGAGTAASSADGGGRAAGGARGDYSSRWRPAHRDGASLGWGPGAAPAGDVRGRLSTAVISVAR